MKLNVLVVGGTSFFGREIVKEFANTGNQVWVLSRGTSPVPKVANVMYLVGDRNNAEQVEFLLSGKRFDVVVDNIAFDGRSVSLLLDVLDSSVGHYIMTSSIAAYLELGWQALPAIEDAVNPLKVPSVPSGGRYTSHKSGILGYPDGVIPYAIGKLQAERVLLQHENVRHTIFRLPTVVGPWDNSGRSQFYFERIIDERPLLLTNGGVQTFHPVYSGDIATAYLKAATIPDRPSSTYNIAQDCSFQLIDWLALCAELLAKSPDFVSIPRGILDEHFGSYEENGTYTTPVCLDISRAVDELGFQPTPVDHWTEETLRWYVKHRESLSVPGYKDRAAEVTFAETYRRSLQKLDWFGNGS